MESPDIDTWAKARYDEYLEQFTPETLNDEQMLLELCYIEHNLNQIREKVDQSIESGDAHTRIKALSDVKRGLLADYNKIQSELGISRSKREENKEIKDEIPRFIQEANEFLAENSVQIQCPHCLSEPAEVIINQGFILFHFREDVSWSWRQTCPRCHLEFEISGSRNVPEIPDGVIQQ